MLHSKLFLNVSLNNATSDLYYIIKTKKESSDKIFQVAEYFTMYMRKKKIKTKKSKQNNKTNQQNIKSFK